MSETIQVTGITVENQKPADPRSWGDHASIVALFPWFAELPAPMKDAARERYLEMGVDDVSLLPTTGMDNKEEWEKEFEKWFKNRAIVLDEVAAALMDESHKKTVVSLLAHATTGAVQDYHKSALSLSAIYSKLAPNGTRKIKVIRSDAIDAIHMTVWAFMSKADIGDYARFGACAKVLFNANEERPIIGQDGFARAVLPGGESPFPFTTIKNLAPLVRKVASNLEERWSIIPGVESEVREFIVTLLKDKLPRATVLRTVDELRAKSATYELGKNPSNKVAQATISTLGKKAEKQAEKTATPATPATPAASAATPQATPAADDSQATPATPASKIADHSSAESDACDTETIAWDMYESLSDAKSPRDVWKAFLTLIDMSEDCDADIALDAHDILEAIKAREERLKAIKEAAARKSAIANLPPASPEPSKPSEEPSEAIEEPSEEPSKPSKGKRKRK